jgi:hypothetical protein
MGGDKHKRDSMEDGARQRGRNCTEQFVKGVGWMPVCKCDHPMDKQQSLDQYREEYKCPKCGWKWCNEQIH